MMSHSNMGRGTAPQMQQGQRQRRSQNRSVTCPSPPPPPPPPPSSMVRDSSPRRRRSRGGAGSVQDGPVAIVGGNGNIPPAPAPPLRRHRSLPSAASTSSSDNRRRCNSAVLDDPFYPPAGTNAPPGGSYRNSLTESDLLDVMAIDLTVRYNKPEHSDSFDEEHHDDDYEYEYHDSDDHHDHGARYHQNPQPRNNGRVHTRGHSFTSGFDGRGHSVHRRASSPTADHFAPRSGVISPCSSASSSCSVSCSSSVSTATTSASTLSTTSSSSPPALPPAKSDRMTRRKQVLMKERRLRRQQKTHDAPLPSPSGSVASHPHQKIPQAHQQHQRPITLRPPLSPAAARRTRRLSNKNQTQEVTSLNGNEYEEDEEEEEDDDNDDYFKPSHGFLLSREANASSQKKDPRKQPKKRGEEVEWDIPPSSGGGDAWPDVEHFDSPFSGGSTSKFSQSPFDKPVKAGKRSPPKKVVKPEEEEVEDCPLRGTDIVDDPKVEEANASDEEEDTTRVVPTRSYVFGDENAEYRQRPRSATAPHNAHRNRMNRAAAGGGCDAGNAGRGTAVDEEESGGAGIGGAAPTVSFTIASSNSPSSVMTTSSFDYAHSQPHSCGTLSLSSSDASSSGGASSIGGHGAPISTGSLAALLEDANANFPHEHSNDISADGSAPYEGDEGQEGGWGRNTGSEAREESHGWNEGGSTDVSPTKQKQLSPPFETSRMVGWRNAARLRVLKERTGSPVSNGGPSSPPFLSPGDDKAGDNWESWDVKERRISA